MREDKVHCTISLSLLPSFRNLSLSSPSSGGALYNRVGVSERCMGEPESLIVPAVGCSHSQIKPRAWSCASLNTWLTVLMGPQGIPAARNFVNHSSVSL